MIPQSLNDQLLEVIQSLSFREIEDDAEYSELFVWILCVGGTFTRSEEQLIHYARLASHQLCMATLTCAEEEAKLALHKFVWPERIFKQQWTAFWRIVESVWVREG